MRTQVHKLPENLLSGELLPECNVPS
jgi:hypothetical protein